MGVAGVPLTSLSLMVTVKGLGEVEGRRRRNKGGSGG